VLWAPKDSRPRFLQPPDSYEAWIAGYHDDLVRSVALTC
jgi:hypothetical protein